MDGIMVGSHADCTSSSHEPHRRGTWQAEVKIGEQVIVMTGEYHLGKDALEWVNEPEQKKEAA